MNVLLACIRSTLAELDLGLKGDLTMSEPMERLMQARSAFDDAQFSAWQWEHIIRSIVTCTPHDVGIRAA